MATIATSTSTLSPVDPRDVLYTRFLGPLAADKYALTMASALFEADRSGFSEGSFTAETTFQMFVRRLPTTGEGNVRSDFLLTAGLPFLASWLEGWQFSAGDIATLRRQKDPKGSPLFSPEFVDMLAKTRLTLDIDAMPDGSLAFAHEPLLQVKGQFWQCLMIEAMVLNIMNTCSNIATLAAQVVDAADGRPVWEFGLSRAQDIGGLAPAYAAFVGGAAGTSNMLADKFFEIPTAGTMAHALVMVAEDEISAFRLWAKGMPNLGMFLVDTYDSLQGVRHAVQVCQEEGVDLQGIRLDSGDLARLSQEARVILDEAGFTRAKIFASNDLDPAKIKDLLAHKAPIDTFGVGTWLAAAVSNPALGGVYKLAEVTRQSITRDVMKFSEEPSKATLIGVQEVVRFLNDEGKFAGDVLVAKHTAPQGNILQEPLVAFDRHSAPKPTTAHVYAAGQAFERPLQPLMRQGQMLTPVATALMARERAAQSRQRFTQGCHAGVEAGLYHRWQNAIAANNARKQPTL